jgi:hypothetical protein
MKLNPRFASLAFLLPFLGHLRLGFSAGNLTVILPGPLLAVIGVVAGCGAVALLMVAVLHRRACRPHMRTAT